MKLITRNFDPASRLHRYLFHADPEDRVLHDIRVGGVWKRTGSARLENTLRVIDDYLRREPRESVNVLDLGASDGTTTIELVERLRKTYRVTAWLADKYLWLDRFERGRVVEYRTTDGAPVMVRRGRLALRLPRSEHRWHLLANLLASLYMRYRPAMHPAGRISLMQPRINEYPDIHVIELDALRRNEELVGKMDVIRASNVLHREYFDERQIATAVGNLHDYLRDGGCMVISRNVDRGAQDRGAQEIECGSLWRKTPQGFVLESEFGGGSDIRSLVTSL